MNITINEAHLNVLDLPSQLNTNKRPYIEERNLSLYSRVSKSLIKTLDVIASAIREDEFHDSQHPSVKLFIELFRESGLHWCMKNNDWMFEFSPGFIKKINEFLNDYEQEVQSYSFKKKLHNMLRRGRRNAESLLDYCDELFDYYSRLLVVRVDFHYQPEFYDDVSEDQVVDDRNEFLRKVKRKFDKLLGLSWKLEYEPQRKFHYHFVFFFDGNKTRQDITLGQLLGELWLKVTGDTGSYHNCNYEDKNYPKKYLGLIRYDDGVKRDALDKVIYLTKNDEKILAVLCNGRDRIFGRMELPVRTAKRRPRKYK